MRLLETISRFFGRVEVVLAGVDETLRNGELAIAAGEPMRARAFAHVVLARLPGSPLGLALLADACEAAGLDAELALTLEDLAARLGSRAEVWVRLARARAKTGAPVDQVRDALVRALATAEAGSAERREALLQLSDLDLAQGDGARAELWLERLADARSPDVALRRAEARLARRDLAGARAAIDAVEASPTDGRAALVRGRVLAFAGVPAAFAPLLRAYVLEEPGASELLSAALGWIASDEAQRSRIRLVVEAQGEVHLARWRAAFARAEGRHDEAREALRDALKSGDTSAARPLLDAALDDEDIAALDEALAALAPSADEDPLVGDARRLAVAARHDETTAIPALFARLGEIQEPRARPWADAVRRDLARVLVPEGRAATWPVLLAHLDAHARALHDLESTSRLAQLAAERARPVRVAIVGEFNAGKSTFINALIGEDVAPTGVLPTTATLHHLRYAPDPIARILFDPSHEPPERIVAVADLRATLKRLTAEIAARARADQADSARGASHAGETGGIRRVEILLPFASLTRVEVLDTPGFNAPDASHARAAQQAFDEADAVIWLLDAGQPLKQTERVILDQARDAGIPVQVLVNKVDRLGKADVDKVMELVHGSLADMGLASWSPPVALSARLALAGRLGDEAALASSGWAAVQSLFDEQIVGRSEELKERALRRRTAIVVKDLAARAARQAEEERASQAAAEERSRAMGRAAAMLDRDADALAEKLAQSLDVHAKAWIHDLDVVVTGRDREAAATDPVLLRYRVDRALGRLAPPLADALAALSGEGRLAPFELAPMARVLVRQLGFSGSFSAEALAHAAIASLAEHLAARAVPPRARATASGRASELEAIEAALHGAASRTSAATSAPAA